MSEIEPDTRDWADVLEAGCAECGFTGDEDVSVVPDYASTSAEVLSEVLTRPNATERTQPDRWSDVEYAAELSQISGDQWDRVGYRADGREFTVTSLTRYGLHELRHHLQDVGA